MSKDITNIANWKDKYSFLSNVLKAYDEFDSNVDIYTNEHKYHHVCELIMSRLSGNVMNHKSFCMKLIRNLGHYDADTNFFNPSYARCNILYNWIYNTIENLETANELIIKCFQDYIDIMSPLPGQYKCSYDAFNSIYFEPRKITILKSFYDNISDIIDKLNEEYSLTDSPSQNFVCECVKIYNEIEKDHCSEVSGTDNKQVQTCQMLKDFKLSYMQYIYKRIDKNDKIPSLEDVDVEYIHKCQKNQGTSPLSSSEGARAPQPSRLTRPVSGIPDASLMSEEINNGDRTNSLSPTVFTALGTVAGASSILALLYKFSPARRCVHSGIGRSTGRISSNLYGDEPNELLFDGFQGEDMSSYNTRYNVGYGSV